jgi:hypothetical protein
MPTPPSVPRRVAALAAAGAILIPAGCGSSDGDEAPAACLATSNTYLQARL